MFQALSNTGLARQGGVWKPQPAAISPEPSSASQHHVGQITRPGGMRGAFESAGPISATDGVSDNSGLRCNRSPASRDSIYRVSEIDLSISYGQPTPRSLYLSFFLGFCSHRRAQTALHAGTAEALWARQEHAKALHKHLMLLAFWPAHSTGRAARQ